MGTRHFLNNIEIPVLNAAELSQSFAWDFPSPNAKRTLTDSIEIAATNDNQDACNVVDNWIRTNGVHNSIPYRCVDTQTGLIFFDGQANLWSASTVYNRSLKRWKINITETNQLFEQVCEGVNLRRFSAGISQNIEKWNSTKSYKKGNQVEYNKKIYKAKSPNILAGIIPGDSAKWEYIADVPYSNAFQYADYEEVFYLINQPFEFGDALMIAFLTAYLIEQFVTLGEILTGDGTNPLTATNAAIKIAIRLAYIAIAIVSLVNAIGVFVPLPHKYYYINIKKLLERAFKFLGYEFETSVFIGDRAFDCWNEETSISGTKKGRAKNNPLPSESLLSFMGKMASKFNSKFKIDSENKKVLFHRVDYFYQAAGNFQIPNLQENGTETYNLEELTASFKLSYMKDTVDKNTYSESDNMNEMCNSCTVHYSISNSINQIQSGLKGTKEIELPFARARRKTKQNEIEFAITEMFKAISNLPGMPKLSLSEDRIGMMLLDTHSIGVSRCAIIKNKRIAASDAELNDPVRLYLDFHKVSSIFENQWKIKNKENEFPIIPAQFVRELQKNNVCTEEGSSAICVIGENRRKEDTGLHKITYRVKEEYISKKLITETIVRGE